MTTQLVAMMEIIFFPNVDATGTTMIQALFLMLLARATTFNLWSMA